MVIYEAFAEGTLEAPKHLARTVHNLYSNPSTKDFRPRTIWSISNAFTSAFKALDPIPQFRATAKLENSWKFGSHNHERFSQYVSYWVKRHVGGSALKEPRKQV